MLTMGADVQDDRLEYAIWGWGADDECWLIEHQIILGSPGLEESWAVLAQVIYRTYEHESGALLGLDRVCIDTQGHFTGRVYDFTHRRGPLVVPIKGSNQVGAPMIPAKGTPSGPRNILRFDLGGDAIKDQLFSYLAVEKEGPGYVHFPEHPFPGHPEHDVEWFKQLVAEVPAIRFVSGQKTRYYKQIRARNEALDCWCYAYAGFKMANFGDRLLPARLEQLKYVAPAAELAPEPAIETAVLQPATAQQQPATPARPYLYELPAGSGGWL
jgi:phage terminase large subunit GpA-like protein